MSHAVMHDMGATIRLACFCAGPDLGNWTWQTLDVCGHEQRARVYRVDAVHIQAAILWLTQKCESAALRIGPGAGMLSENIGISGANCGGSFSISLLGEPSSTSGVPSTRILLQKRHIGISQGAAVCMQDIALQDGEAPTGGALWVTKARLSMLRCRISNSEATHKMGGAISIDIGSVADLVQCHFVSNRARRAGGALSIDDISTVSINRCVFAKNAAG